MPSNHPGDPEFIRQRMSDLRSGMREELGQVKQRARQAVDWRTYVAKYPFACVGVAVLAGFTLVPSKQQVLRPSQEQLEELVRQGKIDIRTDNVEAKSQEIPLSKKVLLGVGTVAARALMAYAGKKIGEVARPEGRS